MEELDVMPPAALQERLEVPNKLMTGPGPTNCEPRILHAMSLPVLGHLHAETLQLMDEIKEGVRYAFQTRASLVVALSASGHGGMEATLCNLLSPGDHLLVLVNGHWGERAADVATRYGVRVSKVQVPPGEACQISVLEDQVTRSRPDVLFVVHGESSTGVLQPLEGLGAACHRHGCLLAVDCVASLGAAPLFMDRWEIDGLYTGSQKVLGAAPGITPMAFSALAQDRMFARTRQVPYYWDMKLIGQYWGCFPDKPRIYHHTASASLLYALREALAVLSGRGLRASWSAHARCTRRLCAELDALGPSVRPFVREAALRLPSVTAISVPGDVDLQKAMAHITAKRIDVAGGLGPTAGRVIRFGLMGYNATDANVRTVVLALQEALRVGRSKL